MRETTLCYIEKDNQYLMLHRTKKNNNPNKEKWIGVGGKIEAGETPDECLLREVREETGLLLTKYQYWAKLFFYSDVYEDEIMYLYTADEYEGEIVTCNEGDLEWVDKSKIMSLNLWEGDKAFLQKLLKNDLSKFVMKLHYQGEKLVNIEVEG